MKTRFFALPLAILIGLGTTAWAGERVEKPQSFNRLRLAEERAYWFARYNLNALLLMSGLGERLKVPLKKRKALASKLGFDLKRLPKNPYLLKAVYASGELYFQKEGDFRDLSTLYWDTSKMDRTLDPSAQAMAIIKSADKNLRSRYHETPKDKFIAAVQLNEAMALARTMETRLKRQDGRYAPRKPGGAFSKPRDRDQFLVLWAYSKLSAFLSEAAFPYARRPAQSKRFLGLAGRVYKEAPFEGPLSIADTAIALEAAVWYARASGRSDVDARIRRLAIKLRTSTPGGSVEAAFKVRGQAAAALALKDRALMRRAEESFRKELIPFWDGKARLFRTRPAGEAQTFTPVDLAALFGALNALRKNPLASDAVIGQANARFTDFFESAIIASGIQYSHAIPLAVNPLYQKRYPKAFFAAPEVPLSIQAGGRYGYGGCPMFQKEIWFKDGFWKFRSDGQYRTFPALFLADMITPNLPAGG